MKNKISFSPSTNIVRDENNELSYLPTDNTQIVFDSIVSNYLSGFRSFYIVGNYGTGKSSFLWALAKTINFKRNFFNYKNNLSKNVSKFETYLFVGEYSSFMNHIAEYVGIKEIKNVKPKDILNKFKSKLVNLKNQKKGFIIIVDEFGKFLEFASKNNSSEETYFIQQFAELINDRNFDALFITTLHQDFNSYSFELSKSQRNEWSKIKGRFYEIPFNENIEHLLLLASERINEKKYNLTVSKKDLHILTDSIINLKAYFLDSIRENNNFLKLLPLDTLSAATLTLALQRYGQSERSLFTFLESKDKFTIDKHDYKSNPLFNLSSVYDYLSFHFYSYLSSKNNPDYTQWSAIKIALERAEAILPNKFNSLSKIIKSIGLLNIFALKSAKINLPFLETYSKISLGVHNAAELIQLLVQRKIVRFLDFASKFILFDGTDLDIELEIKNAAKKIDQINNVVPYLNKYFSFEIPAKSHFYRTGTPRFFKFVLTNEPIEDFNFSIKADGIINIVFNDSYNEGKIKTLSKNTQHAILYGLFSNTEKIRNIIFEINKILKVIEENRDDRIALRELDLIFQAYTSSLNSYFLDSVYSSKISAIKWFFQGNNVSSKVLGRKSFNRLLSTICEKVFYKTVIYKNELVNRNKISSPISTAKRNYFTHLIENHNENNLAFKEEYFPPEKTIYLSLLQNTGIHKYNKNGYVLSEPNESSFRILWQECEDFLESSKSNHKQLAELYELLYSPPFMLKKGFVDFWIPTFLFIKKLDYALFQNDNFIPDLNLEIIDIITKNPRTFKIKAFNLEGVRQDLFNKYRTLIGNNESIVMNKKGFIDIIKPFLIFYKQLNNYSKNTKRLSKTSLSFREVIIDATDPEKIFFEDFPLALGYDLQKLRGDKKLLESFIEDIRNSINELRTCFDLLIDRIINKISNELFGEKLHFLDLKLKLFHRYENIKEYLLLPYQKSFLNRVYSDIEDKNSWISSISYSAFNKHLDNLNDNEEELLIDKLISIFRELDNLCDFKLLKINKEREEVAKIELQFLGGSNKKFIIRYPKSKVKTINKIYENILKEFSSDKEETKAAILKLINDNFANEEN